MRERSVMWAIVGLWSTRKPFLYVDTALTRKEMIARHTRDKGKSWADCRAAGDKVTKIIIDWEYPD